MGCGWRRCSDGRQTRQGEGVKGHQNDIIGLFAHHKVAANLLMAIMILSGIFALDRLNVQFFPSFDLDVVTVRVVWTGASAEDIEDGITNPLEQRLRSVDSCAR
jgi:multidrug efflux pump subunit AcrB